MKLAVNTVIFGLNQALAEGLVLAESAGIDARTAYDILAVSAVGAPYVGYKRAAFLEPEDTPVGFVARPRREGSAAHRGVRGRDGRGGTPDGRQSRHGPGRGAVDRPGADMSRVASQLRLAGRG